MGEHDEQRMVRIEREALGRYVAVNARGGRLEFGSGDGDAFTPVELLLAAIGGCSGIDVDFMTTRRAEPAHFAIVVSGDKVRDDSGSHLDNIAVTFRVDFPDGPDGDQARAILPDVIVRSHDRLCTVSRTVERETPVRMTADQG